MANADVITLIEADHREVERLFASLKNEPETRLNVLPVLVGLLTAHSRAEESEVYPVAISEAGETEEVAHSQEEHEEAEQMMERLQAMDPTTGEFETLLRELTDAVLHHVEEEETKVLPGLREQLSTQRLTELAEAFASARKEHLGETPDEITREELVQQARNAGREGVSSMSREELKEQRGES